jgi:DNA-binding PadR family transcriptional regulator
MTPSQTDYIILAYLAGGPEHGYRLIERLREDNLDTIAGFSVPNIYQALRKLHARGAVGLKVKRSKSRPDQKIYNITEEGRKLLDGLIQDNSVFAQQIRFRSDLVFTLANKIGLGSDDLRGAVEKRLECLTSELQDIQVAWRTAETAESGASSISEIAMRHQIRFLKNEIDFYRKTLKSL